MHKTRKAATQAVNRPADVRLPADLGIEHARELHRQLLTHVGEARPLTLDGAGVSRIHTAALQVFCMFCEDRRQAGRETHWHHPSDALRSAAALLGVTQLMQLTREQI